MKKTLFLLLIILLFTVVGCSTNQNQSIVEETTVQEETKQKEEEIEADSKNEEGSIAEKEEKDAKGDKESKEIDYTKYKYWVVFYDQYDNELQREALLYGSVPEYKGILPEGFIKWTYKLTGYDVKEFQPIKTNTNFKAVCEYVEPVYHSSSGSSPSPSPSPTCSRTDTIIYLRDFADTGEYSFNDDTATLSEPEYLIEMFTYDSQTSTYSCESATSMNVNSIGPGYTGKFIHFDGQNFEVCPNINSHNISNSIEGITAHKLSETDNSCQFKIYVSPYNVSNTGYSVSINDDQGGQITYDINGDILTFTSGDITPTTTATITSLQDLTKHIDVTLNFKACLAGNTLINMADGTKRRVDTLKTGDKIAAFDHNTGKKTVSTVKVFFKYDEPKPGAFTLTFDDDIDVTVVNAHSFFEKESNKYIPISKYNIDDYIGHLFYNAEENRWVKLNKVTYIDEKVDTYIILTDKTLNCLTNGMLSLEDDFYTTLGNIFEFDSNLKINIFKKTIDLLKWGYWSFDHLQYMNKDVYDALNLKYLNVAIGKGMTTEEIIEEYDEYAGSYESDYID